MTTEQLRKFHNIRPFQPFVIHLADGRDVQVRHPERLAYSGGRTLAVFEEPDAAEIIDLLLVASLKALPARKKSGGGNN